MKYISQYESISNSRMLDHLNKINNDNYYVIWSHQSISDSDKIRLLDNLISMTDTTYTLLKNKLKDLGYYNIYITDSREYLSGRNDFVIHMA